MFTKRLFVLITIIILAVLISIVIQQYSLYEHWVDEKLDSYFERMSDSDLIARGLDARKTTKYHYKDIYHMSTKTPLAYQQKRIDILLKIAYEKLDGYKILKALPWKIKIIPKSIENGFPHTLKDTIYIHESLLFRENINSIVETLIHEKIHVFQRAYPTLTQDLVRNIWGFQPSDYKDVLQRNNPDLDGINYVMHNQVIIQRYNSEHPRNLADSSVFAIDLRSSTPLFTSIKSATFLGFPHVVKQFEHPYEIMACLIAMLITNPDILNIYADNKNVLATHKWITENM